MSPTSATVVVEGMAERRILSTTPAGAGAQTVDL